MARWRRRCQAAAVAATALAACCLTALPAGASPAATSATTPAPTTTAAAGATAQSGGPAVPAPAVPPPPAVPPSVTDGQPAGSLLSQALALTVTGSQNQPLLQALGQVSARLDEDTITAKKASAEAAAARAVAGKDAAEAAAAQRSYDDLATALRSMAVRMYETGSDGLSSNLPTFTADQMAWSAVYANATVDPRGLLGERRSARDRATAAAVAASRESQLADRSAAQAASALAEASAQAQQLRQQLAAVDQTSTAEAMASERLSVAEQAAGYVTRSTSLQFNSAGSVPSQVPTVGVALQWAFAELGKPYLWGGTGPDSFDCSGLTQFVWRQAGVAIPRVAADQDAWAVPVPLSQLLPGDLVFFGTTDIHHVGIYIGDGLMINAPHTGAVVSVSSIWWSDLNGFGRVHAPGTPVPLHALPTPAKPVVPVVLPGPGPVPSQSKPPAGWAPAPGETAPMPGYATPTTSTTTAPDASTSTTSDSSTSTTSDSSTSSTSTSTTNTTAVPPSTTGTAPEGTSTSTGGSTTSDSTTAVSGVSGSTTSSSSVSTGG